MVRSVRHAVTLAVCQTDRQVIAGFDRETV